MTVHPTDETTSHTDETAGENHTDELLCLRAMQRVSTVLGPLLEIEHINQQATELVNELVSCHRCMILLMNDEHAALEYGHSVPVLSDIEKQTMLEMAFITTFNALPDTPLDRMLQGQIQNLSADLVHETRLEDLLPLLGVEQFTLCPMITGEKLIGAILVHTEDDTPLSDAQQRILQTISPSIAAAIYNGRRHNQTVQELATTVHEMNILQQIDEELNDTIELRYVFRTILDWALRFTNADAAHLCLYDASDDVLTMMAHYGYLDIPVEINNRMPEHLGGITRRVARSGHSEVVPDVSFDKDYMAINPPTRTQLSVPILREEQVIAVMSLESNTINGFTDGHLSFVEKLAQRAGVAVDNARLFTETRREREKLSLILRNIADVVLVVDTEARIILMNQSAKLALHLPVDEVFTGKHFNDAIQNSTVKSFWKRARENEDSTTGELTLPNKRTYHAHAALYRGTGWIIVMQDITHFKETDKLKTELVATVSHDLKQPLSVMRGYLDLLYMTSEQTDRTRVYMGQIDTAFYSMRQLIDDLLDLAHIEAGLELNMVDIDIEKLLNGCVEGLRQKIIEKSMDVNLDIPSPAPVIQADEIRLQQVFNNLIGNAVKYSHENDHITIRAETRRNYVQISVEDNGMGISPDNQAKIFERFYRVRNDATENIDGTGLGLAIVKSLIEAHNGSIDLKSQIGEGSTFRVTLPIF